MSYSPRILRGRKRFGAPSQTVPLDRPSFQEICHKSDECPPIQAMGHCKNGQRVQCVRRGVYCTARKKQENQCCTKRTEVYYGMGLHVLLWRVARFDGLNDSHITPGTMIFCSMISTNNFSDCVVAPCEQGSTSKNLCPYCKPQNMVIFKGVIYTERSSGSTVIESFAEHNKMNILTRRAYFYLFKPCLLMLHVLRA